MSAVAVAMKAYRKEDPSALREPLRATWVHAPDSAFVVAVGRADPNTVGGGMSILVRRDGSTKILEISQ
jgi:hypothetical protein